jgi:hypothetical protein
MLDQMNSCGASRFPLRDIAVQTKEDGFCIWNTDTSISSFQSGDFSACVGLFFYLMEFKSLLKQKCLFNKQYNLLESSLRER